MAAALAAASAIWPTAPALAGGRAADVASASGLAANSGALGLTAGAAGVPCPPNTPRIPAPLPSTAAVEKGIDGDGAAENGMYGAVEKRPAEERLAENVELVLPKTNPKFGAPAGGLGGSGRGWMGTVSVPSSVLKSSAGLAGAPPGLKGEGDFDEYSLIGDAVASESASDAAASKSASDAEASKSASGRRRASVASCSSAAVMLFRTHQRSSRGGPPPLMADGAREDLVAALRTQALVRALVQRSMGLISGANHEAAVDWVHGSFRHHRFGSTDGHAVSRACAEFEVLLRRHAGHAKADAMEALLCRVLGIRALGTRATDAAAKPVSLLYWLADTQAMLASESARWRGGPPSLARRVVQPAGLGHGPATEPVQWGYSSASGDEGEDEQGSSGAPSAVCPGMSASPAGDGGEELATADATTASSAPAEAAPARPVAPDAPADAAAVRPTDLLSARPTGLFSVSRDGGPWAAGTDVVDGAALIAAARGFGRPSRARLLHSTAMAMSGCAASDWEEVCTDTGREGCNDIGREGCNDSRIGREVCNDSRKGREGCGDSTGHARERARGIPLAGTAGTGRGREGAHVSTAAGSAAAHRGETPGASWWRIVRLSVSGRAHASRCGEPTAALPVLAELGSFASGVATLSTLAHALLTHPNLPTVLRVLGHSIRQQMIVVQHAAWRGVDLASLAAEASSGAGSARSTCASAASSARAAAGHSGVGCPPRRAGLLALADSARCMRGGGARRLAELTALAADLSALPALNAVLGLAARKPDSAAEATAAVLSLLLRRCQAHEAACGPMAAGGAPIFFWLFVLLRCLLAYVRALDTWVGSGQLRDAPGELFVYRRGAAPALDDPEAAWESTFALRPAAAIPELLLPLASAVLVAGKSRHLARTLAPAAGETEPVEAGALQAEVVRRLLGVIGPASRAPDFESAVPSVADSGRALWVGRPASGLPAEQPVVQPRVQGPSQAPMRPAAPVDLRPWRISLAPRRPCPFGRDDRPEGAVAARGRMAEESGALHDAGLCPQLCRLPSSAPKPTMAELPGAAELDHLMLTLADASRGGSGPGAQDTGVQHNGSEASAVDSRGAACRLPPLTLLLREALVGPVARACGRAGPELLARLPELLETARMLHAVVLAGEPRLTSPPLERLFTAADTHAPWRPSVGELTISLHEILVDSGVLKAQAARFTFEVLPVSAAERHAGMRPVPAQGAPLDSANVRAFDALALTYTPPWPLQLAFSAAALAKQQQVFALLLRLRRAKWSLESLPLGRAGGASRAGGGFSRAGVGFSLRPWWTLRSELLHAIDHLYGFFCLAVISAEWRVWVARLPEMPNVDAVRAAYQVFCDKVAARCFLEAGFSAELAAIDAILTLALRLRVQLEALGTLPPAAHEAAARRWRTELRRSIQLLTATLDKQPASRALGEALNFNHFYDG